MPGRMDIDPIHIMDSDEEIEELYADLGAPPPQVPVLQPQNGQVACSVTSTTADNDIYYDMSASVPAAYNHASTGAISDHDEFELDDDNQSWRPSSERSVESPVVIPELHRTPTPSEYASSTDAVPPLPGLLYDSEDFEWSGHLRRCMRQVFKDQYLSLSLLSACNAVLDSRNVIYAAVSKGHHRCIPYALASLFSSTMTVVIHFTKQEMEADMKKLQCYGRPSYYLSGLVERSQADIDMMLEGSMLNRMTIFFVLAEDLIRSRAVYTSLRIATDSNKLERFVIPDAHGICQENQASLSNLRTWFPNIPILAVSPTADMNTLVNLSQKLGFSGFSKDLRSNSRNNDAVCIAPSNRYIALIPIIPKISAIRKIIDHIVKYATANRHRDQYGIVYCSKIKDMELLADQLRKMSKGAIEVGICHQKMSLSKLQELSQQWLDGKFRVLCRPIDSIRMNLSDHFERPDVRFTFHTTVPYNLKDLSQGIKRAGRDGYPSECYVFYRALDVLNVVALMGPQANPSQHAAIHEMAQWAYQVKHCRLLSLTRYLNDHSTQKDLPSTNGDELNLEKQCFNCDICQRPQNEVAVCRSMKLEVWRIIRIIREINKIEGLITMRALTDVVRGFGHDQLRYRIGYSNTVQGMTKTIQHPRYVVGYSELSLMEVDNLLLEMVCRGYLSYHFVPRPYSRSMMTWFPYVIPGPAERDLRTAPEFELMVLKPSDSGAKDTNSDLVSFTMERPRYVHRSRKRKREWLDMSDTEALNRQATKRREVIDLTLDDD